MQLCVGVCQRPVVQNTTRCIATEVLQLNSAHAPLLLPGAALGSGGGREERGNSQQGGTGGGEWGVSGGSTSRERVTAEAAWASRAQTFNGCVGLLALVPSSVSFSSLHHRSHAYSLTTHSLATALLPFSCAGACRRTRQRPPFLTGRVVNELKHPAREGIAFKEVALRRGVVLSVSHLPSSKSSSEFEDIFPLFVFFAVFYAS